MGKNVDSRARCLGSNHGSIALPQFPHQKVEIIIKPSPEVVLMVAERQTQLSD